MCSMSRNLLSLIKNKNTIANSPTLVAKYLYSSEEQLGDIIMQPCI